MKALATAPRSESTGEFVPLMSNAPETPEERSSEGLLGTEKLLSGARAGDPTALDALCRVFAPKLQRFLHARLPGRARGLCDTDDLVQEVVSRALERLERFQYRGPGSFWGYLRAIGLNHVSEIVRRQEPSLNGSSFDGVDSNTGPIGQLLRQERFEAFERALGSLSASHRQAVLSRLELRLPFLAIAKECGFPSADAARMAVKRSLEQIIERMSHDGHLAE